jgi:UDP-3-O-[3-hydroxymyristoyl] N-acetylglucosamine deacetylase/3-hydroxyacyl-[acyl-carrier-protein] dehydratase
MKQSTTTYHSAQPPVIGIEEIMKILPHRYPFQLVDKIIHIEHSYIVGVKNVTINEPFFQGHFPTSPVMPGVLQVEALIQTGGVLALKNYQNPGSYLTYFLSIDKCKFRGIVVPGDALVMHCSLVSEIKMGFAKFEGQAFVEGKLVCEATMMAKIQSSL